MQAPPISTIPTIAKLPRVIRTARLILRPQVESDAEQIFPYVSDPELTQFVTWAAHNDIEETRAWIRNTNEWLAEGSDLVWTIEHEGKACGTVGLHDIKWGVNAVRFDKAEMGYWIARPLWGKGLMTEAATAATGWAFDKLGLHKVTIGCIESNEASRRVIEKIGYRFLCKYEDDVWRDGQWRAQLRYELTAAEWADTTRTLRFHRPAT